MTRGGGLSLFAALLTLPGLIVGMMMSSAGQVAGVIVIGLGLAGSVTLMLSAARVRGRALTVSALFAVSIAALVPTIAIESGFAWFGVTSGVDQPEAPMMLSALTGVVQLMMGFGFPIALIVMMAKGRGALELRADHYAGLSLIFLAALYLFVIVMRGFVWPLDVPVLGLLFAVYVWRLGRPAPQDDDAPAMAASESRPVPDSGRALSYWRFGYGAVAAILLSFLFVEALSAGGRRGDFGVTQVAFAAISMVPLIVGVILLILRGASRIAISVLNMSVLGALTLVPSMMAFVMLMGAYVEGGLGVVAFDDRQKAELLMMASQTVFTVALISGRLVRWRILLIPVALFALSRIMSLVQPGDASNLIQGLFIAVYFGGAIVAVALDRTRLYALGGALAPRRRVRVIVERSRLPVP